MISVQTTTPIKYKDLDLNFTVHPVKKDVNKHIDNMAVIHSVKNLLLTNHYEKLFHPEIGSNVRKLLFDNLDSITAIALKREIEQTLTNFEPRISVQNLELKPDYDNNAYSVTITFSVLDKSTPITVEFSLSRVR